MTHRERERPDDRNADSHWESVARVLAGAAEPGEADQVRARLAENAAEAELLALLDRAIPAPPTWEIGAAKVEVALKKVNAERARLAPGAPRLRLVRAAATQRKWMPMTLAAAAVLLLAAMAVWPRLRGQDADPAAKDLAVTTRAGERVSLSLADGTRIVVAPLSSVHVPASSQDGAGAREVELTGQAMFEVRHNADRPFVVRTPNATVEDIGTTFTVRDAGTDTVVVRVTEGSVRMASRGATSGGVTLVAGDVGVLSSGQLVAMRGSVTANDTAWAQGALEFRDASMDEVRDAFLRWYGIRLRIADSVLERRHVTATLDDEPVDRALQIIALALGAEIQREGDTAVVRLSRGAR
jgi:transmembrane sensor